MLWWATQRTTPFWRCVVLVLLLQTSALVPLKMAGRWMFNVKYVIYVPEYHLYA